MSFLWSLPSLPFLGGPSRQEDPTQQDQDPASPSNTSDDPRRGRRQLVRQTQHNSLQSPFYTPNDSFSSSQQQSKLDSLDKSRCHSASPGNGPSSDNTDTESDEGCLVTTSSIDDIVRIDIVSELPYEVAMLILGHLPSHHCLLNCSLVSKKWYERSQDPFLWRSFFHRNPGWKLKEPIQLQAVLEQMQIQNRHASLPQQSEGFLLDATSHDADASIVSLDQTRSARNPQGKLHHCLDWRKLYAARYYLARRIGEVVPTKSPLIPHNAIRTRRGPPYCIYEMSRSSPHHYMSENFSDSGDDDDGDDDDDDEAEAEGIEEESIEEQAGFTSPSHRAAHDDVEVSRARLLVEQEALAARGLLSEANLQHQMHLTTRLPERWLPRIDRPETRIFGSHSDYIYCVRTSPSFDVSKPGPGYIITGSRDRTMRIWDVQTGNCLHTLHGHERSILTMDICSEGDIMVSGASDSMLGIWTWYGSAEAQACRQRGETFKPKLINGWKCRQTVMDVRLSDKYLVLGLRNGVIRCYSRNVGERKFERVSAYHQHSSSVNDLRICGDYLAAGYAGGVLETIHIPTGTLHRKFQHKKGVSCVELSSDYLVAGGSDFLIRCWKISTGQLLLTLRGHTELPRSIKLHAERGLLISAGYDGRINVWDVSLLLSHRIVDNHALGLDWRSKAVLHGKERKRLEYMQAQQLQQQQRQQSSSPSSSSSSSQSDNNTANQPMWEAVSPAHPLHDPPAGHRPRFSFRDMPPVHPATQHAAVNQAGTAPGPAVEGAAPPPEHQPVVQQAPPPRRAFRLFDVAFDGKRIISVGESHTLTIREFLPENKRFQSHWEIFS
ncbi:unnamed protein product [Sympodiomycopsis kandeliae]